MIPLRIRFAPKRSPFGENTATGEAIAIALAMALDNFRKGP